MNYYEHHIGDYAEATAHLSFVEDAAYSRCMRKYYATEAPLPADVKQVQRLIGARSKEERTACESVLKEFFTLQDDGWHNARCDEEIARYQEKRAKAQRSAEARWSGKRSDSEGNANASDGSMRTHSERSADALPSECEGNALQSPDSRLQSPDTSKNIPPPSVGPPSRASRLPTDWVLTDVRREIARAEQLDPERTFASFTDYWRAASGANARKHDWDATWRNWCRREADRSKPNGGTHATEPRKTRFEQLTERLR